MTYQLIHDDIVRWASQYKGPKFHALMADPPYHLVSITKRFGKSGSAPARGDVYNRSSKGFMGQTWDGGDIAFNPETWAAMGEHLYDGGFGMAFASSRGWHRLACAIEDAGFIIHPSIFGWCFLSGFPKATQISSQIDKAAAAEPKVIGRYTHPGTGKALTPENMKGSTNPNPMDWGKKTEDRYQIKQPATPLAQTWQSHRYGLQAMKPALEPIILFQKPYVGRPVDCIATTGAGALNIDQSRIPIGDNEDLGRVGKNVVGFMGQGTVGKGPNNYANVPVEEQGRWPANLILDEEGARLLDGQSGELKSGSWDGQETGGASSNGHLSGKKKQAYFWQGDSGGASRMFFQSNWQYEILEQLENADPLRYEPKVSTTEREAGLDSLPARTRNRVNSGGYEDDPKFAPTQMRNHHPTLKPIALTKYLTTLLLPPDTYAPRRILVPFAGAGSEMIGAILAGWDEVTGIEQSTEYIPIAEARLAWWSQWSGWGQTDVDKILASLGSEPAPEQLGLFDSEEE